MRPWILLLLLGCSEYDIKGEQPMPEEGEDPAPDLVVDPSAIDFGAVELGASADAVLTLNNAGDADLELIGLAVTEGADSFSLTRLETSLLEPGASTEVVVSFTPTAEGAVAGSVHVESNDPVQAAEDVPLSGETPAGPAPDLEVSPWTHDFGTVPVGSPVSLSVTLSNAGDADLAISGLSYSSATDELGFDDGSAVYGGLPTTLAPGASRVVTVTYTPIDDTPDEGAITILSDDPDEPEAFASQSGNGELPLVFSTVCWVLDDGVAYETTSSADHVVDSHGDADLYWYEPSGAHGLIGSADPEADFELMRDHVIAHGSVISPTWPLDFDSDSTISTFAYATFTYVMCDFYLQAGDRPEQYTVTTGPVDDGIQVMVNGVIEGRQLLGEAGGNFTLTAASASARNTLIVILVDDSAVDRYLLDLAFLRDGVVME